MTQKNDIVTDFEILDEDLNLDNLQNTQQDSFPN